MSSTIWFVSFLKFFFPGRFFFAKLTKLPIIGDLIDLSLFHDDYILYLPLDKNIKINEDIEDAQDLVVPSQIVEHFVEAAGYHWIMDFCICREGDDCTEYPKDLGCLFLGKPVLGINSKLGRLVSKEEAKAHLLRCREAGLVHMIGRNKLDAVWLGIGPSEQLLTICNCCPCCCLWKIIPNLTNSISDKVNRLPGIQVVVTDKCMGCGECAGGICFTDSISIVAGFATIKDACKGCGRCLDVCQFGAIQIEINKSTFISDAITGIDQHIKLE